MLYRNCRSSFRRLLLLLLWKWYVYRRAFFKRVARLEHLWISTNEFLYSDVIVAGYAVDCFVTPPFNAKMEGEYVYNEAELPDVVVSGKRYGIGSYTSSSLSIVMIGTLGSASKENFLNLMASHPDRLKFTMEKDF